MNRQQGFFLAACIWGGLSMALGAFAAHVLKTRLTPEMLNVFDVGVRYHTIHALALLAISVSNSSLWLNRWTSRAAWAWTIGILFFSGSLYLLALTEIRWLGAVTPVGGIAFLIGWGCLAMTAKSCRCG